MNNVWDEGRILTENGLGMGTGTGKMGKKMEMCLWLCYDGTGLGTTWLEFFSGIFFFFFSCFCFDIGVFVLFSAFHSKLDIPLLCA